MIKTPVTWGFNPDRNMEYLVDAEGFGIYDVDDVLRAINTHDTLVAALDNVVAYHNYHVGGPDWIQQCREALKLAKGE